MANVTIKNLTKKYGDTTVITDLDLEIEDGLFTVLVGPSGCGKTTILRMIAGIEPVTAGDIFIDGENMKHVPPGDRGVAMVFQNYAIYPNMTVKGNIEFGLKNNKVPKEERERLIEEVCEIVDLKPYLSRRPSQLSGGQRQRIALARAMVKKPKIFLMDEPLSNLDAKLRAQMRVELKELHRKLGTTFIYVTHDQVEAMSMADKIVLMNDGKIIQIASPEKIYAEPSHIFSAQFIGTPPMNIFNCEGLDWSVGVRPAKVELVTEKPSGDDLVTFPVSILNREVLGYDTHYHVQTDLLGDFMVTSSETPIPVDTHPLFACIAKKNIFLFNKSGERIAEETPEHKECIDATLRWFHGKY